jgi:hypothetical protein
LKAARREEVPEVLTFVLEAFLFGFLEWIDFAGGSDGLE